MSRPVRSQGLHMARRADRPVGWRGMPQTAWWRALLVWAPLFSMSVQAGPADQGSEAWVIWSQRFTREVDRRLAVPSTERQSYILQLQQALAEAGLPEPAAQAFVLVDRSPKVQAVFVILRTSAGGWHWAGASPVSTGRRGDFEHFVTPIGVFAHTLDNLDFRAEGTFNEHHIRGFGLRGMRVFDFGWVLAERGWGAGGKSPMRLQMHATDPDVLEPRLGRAESKGCVRIPATLNTFLDRYGLLDGDYELGLARGKALWVLRADRQPIAWPGRYLVIVDSKTSARPAWSPAPASRPQPARAN